MSRYCLALDTVDDPFLIDQYIKHHQNVWPEIIESIEESGIKSMEIYHVSDRLFMIIEAEKGFSFKKKSKMDAHNPYVIKWEELMSQYQKVLPVAHAGEKWILMEKIFDLIETKQ